MGFQIQCEVCDLWQHGICAGFSTTEELPDPYVCDSCLEKKGLGEVGADAPDPHKLAARNARPDAKLRRLIHYLLSLSEGYRSLKNAAGVELESSVMDWQVQLQQSRSPQEVAACLLSLETLLTGYYTWKANRNDWVNMVKSIASDPRKWTGVKELPEYRVGVDTGHRRKKDTPTSNTSKNTEGTASSVSPERLALLQLGFQYQASLNNITRLIRVFQKSFNDKPSAAKSPNNTRNGTKALSGCGLSTPTTPDDDQRSRRKRKMIRYELLHRTGERLAEGEDDEKEGPKSVSKNYDSSNGGNESKSSSSSSDANPNTGKSGTADRRKIGGSCSRSPTKKPQLSPGSPVVYGKSKSSKSIHPDLTLFDFFVRNDTKTERIEIKIQKEPELDMSEIKNLSDVCFNVLSRALTASRIGEGENSNEFDASVLKSIESRIRAGAPSLPVLYIPTPTAPGLRMRTRSQPGPGSPLLDSPASPQRTISSKPPLPYIAFQDFLNDMRAVCEFTWMCAHNDSLEHATARAIWAEVESVVGELLSNSTVLPITPTSVGMLLVDQRWFADMSSRSVLRCTYSYIRRRREQRVPRVVGMRMGRRALTQYPRRLGTLLKRRLQPPRNSQKRKKRRRLFRKKIESEESEESSSSSAEEEDDDEDESD